MKIRLTLSRVIGLLLIILMGCIARPVGFLAYAYYKDGKIEKKVKRGVTNDASTLNETKVEAVISVPGNSDAAVLQISSLVKKAVEERKNISIAGAQHSMGGHTIYPHAIVLDMKGLNYLKFDSVRNILSVGSGTFWSDVIPFLDRFGKSVGVMQSNNSFSVGGSISVNCHGWQPNAAPIASTVESFRLVTAEGKLLTCSRNENKELFSLVMGGYGLFGVITDVELKVVDNKMYIAEQYIIESNSYVKAFKERVTADPSVELAYGRININPHHFMEEAILSTYKIDTGTALRSVRGNRFAGLRRTVFRGSANSAYGKNLRWKVEKASTNLLKGKQFSRNQLCNEGVEIYQNNDPAYTDILHEYFIPPMAVSPFIDSLRNIIPAYNVDLLNITLRNVKKDDDAFLAYANEEVFGFVMLFNQSKDSAAEEVMRSLTQRLVKVAIELKGTYYLPYRLHATKAQMHSAYPNAQAFFNLKRKYDSTELFKNRFYETYK